METTADYPEYPELGEVGKQECERLIERFKENLKKVAESVLSDLYCDTALWIESDAWTNFRNQIVSAMRGWPGENARNAYDWKKIRRKMFEEYREEIIGQMPEDLREENERLRHTIEEYRRSRY